VAVTVVSSEVEAATVVGFLQSQGIEAGYQSMRSVQDPIGYARMSSGPQEVLVRPADLERAKQLLDEAT
jgi:hypothetical protein